MQEVDYNNQKHCG